MTEPLLIWTVYEKPKDYPTSYVVRQWAICGAKPRPEHVLAVAPTLEEARRVIPPYTMRLPRQPGDDPVIVETWL